MLGDLEEKGRMARLLVEIKDPLCLLPENAELKPLLIGEYVQANISGSELKNIYSIPRGALHDDHLVWVAQDDKLDVREVKVLWRDANQVLIRDGLAEGEALITSDLTAPLQGMDINTGNKKENDSRKGAKTQSKH